MPRQAQFTLGYQIRKTSISIPSNIAEGFGRHHTAEYVHHLRYALGSTNELMTQLELARRINVCNPELANGLIADANEVGRMLGGLIRALAAKSPARS